MITCEKEGEKGTHTRHAGGPHSAAEPVLGVVSEGDGMLLVFEWQDGHDRTEDLLLESRVLWAVDLEDGRLIKVALVCCLLLFVCCCLLVVCLMIDERRM